MGPPINSCAVVLLLLLFVIVLLEVGKDLTINQKRFNVNLLVDGY